MSVNAITLNVELANAYGCGMLDAQNIRPSLNSSNARNFLAVPEHVPTADTVTGAADAYRLGYWTETVRVAQKWITDNA